MALLKRDATTHNALGTTGDDVGTLDQSDRLPLIAWALVALPALVMLASIALGAYIDSLTLGPTGFLFVLMLTGVGALGLGVGAAGVVAAVLAQGSKAVYGLLLAVEILLVIFTYSVVWPLLGGWS